MNEEEIEAKNTDALRREIHTYVIRAGRMTSAQKSDYETLYSAWCVPYTDAPLDFKSLFGNENPVVIEIGFGMGQATAIIAAQNPNVNYLGLEVHKPGIGRLLGEIKNRGLKNLRIIEHDAIEVLEKMVCDGSVSGFHVFFPDPWPKKKHHKRRLMQRPRTNLLARKLKNDGYIYMATDWVPYAEFALEELSATEGVKNKYDGFAPHQEWRPETKFERKGLSKEHEIRELFFVKG